MQNKLQHKTRINSSMHDLGVAVLTWMYGLQNRANLREIYMHPKLKYKGANIHKISMEILGFVSFFFFLKM